MLTAACTAAPTDPFALPTDGATPETVAPTQAPTSAPTPTPTAMPVDVTTTPDVITAEWVEAVINTILAEYGKMGAEALAIEPPATAPPEEVVAPWLDRLVDLFDEEYRDGQASELIELARNDDNIRAGLLPFDRFGGPRFMVELVQYSQATCIIAVGRYDKSQSVPSGSTSETLSAISMRPRTEAPRTTANPTPWVLIDSLANTSDSGPNEDSVMLEASLTAYGEHLVNDCQEVP